MTFFFPSDGSWFILGNMAETVERNWKLRGTVELRIGARNHKTQIWIKDGNRIDRAGNVEGPNANWAINLIEARENSVVLDIPNHFCTQEDLIQLILDVLDGGSEGRMEIHCRVSQFNFNLENPARAYATFQFTQYDIRAWNLLCRTMENQQAEVEKLLETLKG